MITSVHCKKLYFYGSVRLSQHEGGTEVSVLTARDIVQGGPKKATITKHSYHFTFNQNLFYVPREMTAINLN
jgi:hypothetical protein